MKQVFSLVIAMLACVMTSYGMGDAASIGIIGGADGPTAIFVTGGLGIGALAVMVAVGVLFAVGVYWLITRNKK